MLIKFVIYTKHNQVATKDIITNQSNHRKPTILTIGLLLLLLLNYKLSYSLYPTLPTKLKVEFVKKKAIDSLQQIIDSKLIENDKKDLPLLYSRIGKLMQAEGFYNLSITYFNKSNDFLSSHGYTEQKAENYNDIATSYRRMDDYQLALEYLQKALNAANKSRSVRIQSYSLNGIGNTYLALQHPNIALKYFQESLNLSKQSNNIVGEAINYANIGEVYFQKGDYNRSISYYYKSIDANRKAKNSRGIKICCTELSRIYIYLNKLDEAAELTDYVLNNTGKIDPSDSVSFYNILSKIQRAQKKYNSSIESATKAAGIAKRIRLRSGSMEAYNSLAETYQALNLKEQYLHAYEKSLNYRDSLISEIRSKEIADLHSMSVLEKKETQIKNLVEENKEKDKENTNSRHLLIIIILSSTLLLVATFLFSRKITNKALKNSNDIEIRYRRSQLNPHFIYNSLNSIQKFIWSNNPEVASVYLSNFSALMRRTLEGMRQDENLLSKEIELLKLYLDLEKQRLSNGFNYEIDIDKNLKPDEVNVPPLILQPFVENAIWHGIAPLAKNEVGSIFIRYRKNKRFIIAQVEDSGIGIRKSITDKMPQSKHHASEGINITSEHLKLTFKAKNIKPYHEVDIVDLSETESNTHGTLVTITIPYNEIF